MKAKLSILLGILSIVRVYGSDSLLWGKSGENWRENQPLRDFSRAGYRESNVPIPSFTNVVNVRDYGAKGDGKADDSSALEKAIAACPRDAKVFLPTGDYLITRRIVITKSNLVVAGAGRDRTRLVLQGSLVELYPRPSKTTSNRPTSEWSWSGGFIEFNGVQEVGIEDLTFAFPETPYVGHFQERGANGVDFQKCENAWARRLSFINADSGIFVSDSRHVTVRRIEFSAFSGRVTKGSQGVAGHHALDFRLGSSLFLADKNGFKVQFYHELGIEHGAHANVYSECVGPDVALDHHQTNVFGNLWTEINVGKGDRIWQNNSHGSTMDEVYWNIHAAKPVRYPEAKLKNIVVGVSGTEAEVHNTNAPWVEVIRPEDITPANIFKAQLEKRIGRTKAQAVLED